jgi:hypothetical protein
MRSPSWAVCTTRRWSWCHDQIADQQAGLRAGVFITTCVCGDPTCGLHLIPAREDGTPICEVVIGREQLRDVLALIHDEGLDLP